MHLLTAASSNLFKELSGLSWDFNFSRSYSRSNPSKEGWTIDKYWVRMSMAMTASTSFLSIWPLKYLYFSLAETIGSYLVSRSSSLTSWSLSTSLLGTTIKLERDFLSLSAFSLSSLRIFSLNMKSFLERPWMSIETILIGICFGSSVWNSKVRFWFEEEVPYKISASQKGISKRIGEPWPRPI